MAAADDQVLAVMVSVAVRVSAPTVADTDVVPRADPTAKPAATPRCAMAVSPTARMAMFVRSHDVPSL